MYCPNCGSENGMDQNYCRGCGLGLKAVAETVAQQFPSKEFAALQRRKTRFRKLGLFSLSMAAFLGFALLLFIAAYYKMVLFGPEVVLGSAVGALVGFLLLSVFFFNYPKLFMKAGRLAPDLDPPPPAHTAKLIDDRPPDYVSSVTENTTEILKVPKPRRE